MEENEKSKLNLTNFLTNDKKTKQFILSRNLKIKTQRTK